MILLPIQTSSFLLALQQNTSLFSSQTLTMKWILVSHRSLHLVIIHHQLHSFCLHSILQSDPIMDYWSRHVTHEMKVKWRAAVDSKGYEVRKLVDGVIAAQDCLRAHPDLDTGKPLRLSNL